MTPTRSHHTATALLTAALGHVEQTLGLVEQIGSRPHRAASTSLVLASLMDDVAVRFAIVAPDDVDPRDEAPAVLSLVERLATVVASGHAVAREAAFCADDPRTIAEVDQCIAATRAWRAAVTAGWHGACARVVDHSGRSAGRVGTVDVITRASDISRSVHPAHGWRAAAHLAFVLEVHLRNLAAASLQLSNLTRGSVRSTLRAAVEAHLTAA